MTELNLEFHISEANNSFKCITKLGDIEVCKCQINLCGKTWTISSWYTDNKYLNKGIGSKTLKYLLRYLYEKFGVPDCVEYIWNGTNDYVYEWMKSHFGAISKCPIAVQKTQCEDDWDSHIYYLNVEKVLDYFK